ncbi:regulator of volume decrease after cellular swelling-domain-containing protein [Suillus subalutaceus]|uniref:regulator of volume decrease after cellular swelling-domain-containing protein n=1 Tax=Suillus subalutaceus TaxID=48586 RepID=UPI001B860BA4|nr:regulator of volume decrease after cellular swelling-domain-containing protein [Suillus subalutaceus]KAG1870707.1 regulator of volume decrease after cellular swelling-domain-containing protein [Suillus subalutaceus]
MVSTTLISTVPQYVSSEEHRNIVGSTPQSFNDIPPVLRHKEDNVRVVLDPPLHTFTEQDCANGTLFVIESALVFMSSTGVGFQVPYPAITLHAIARPESGPSIYCQLDELAGEPGATESPENDEALRHARAEHHPPIFEAMSLCASLHPDPNVSDDDDLDETFMDESAFETFTGEEGEELSEVGRAALEHLESIIDDPYHPGKNGVNGAGEDVESEGDGGH